MKTFLLMLTVLLSLVTHARGDGPNQKATLRDLEGLAVVPVVDEGAVQAGFTKEALQTATELRLRKNGVVVLENAAPPGQKAVLTVRVTAQQLPSSTQYVFAIMLAVVQPMQLMRNEKIMGMATTWDLGPGIGVGDRAEMRELLDEGLDGLSNDWLAVHPKK